MSQVRAIAVGATILATIGFPVGAAWAECSEAAHVKVVESTQPGKKAEIIVQGAPGQAVVVTAPDGYVVTAVGGSGAPGRPGSAPEK